MAKKDKEFLPCGENMTWDAEQCGTPVEVDKGFQGAVQCTACAMKQRWIDGKYNLPEDEEWQ